MALTARDTFDPLSAELAEEFLRDFRLTATADARGVTFGAVRDRLARAIQQAIEDELEAVVQSGDIEER